MPSRNRVEQDRFEAGHEARLLSGGKAYFNLLLHLIHHAKTSIHLQVYIFESDSTGHLIANALIDAARRGVTVYVLVDGYGSQDLSKAFVANLREKGVNLRIFKPLWQSRSFYFGRRMHRKVLVVDARYAIVTGANIGDKYNDIPGQSAWLDVAVCITGRVASQLCQACGVTWRNFHTARRRFEDCIPAATVIDFGQAQPCAVRMRRNDWVRRKDEISRTYRAIFREAKQDVIVLSSYFLPGRSVQTDIEMAAKRGVRLRIIICSKMDVPLVKDAERYMYNWLLRHGVEIYEYRGAMLHGKLATCDRNWMTVGSFNVNDLSARVSIELNLDLRGESIVRQTIAELEELIEKRCERITTANVKLKNNLLGQFMQWVAFRMLRVLFFLGTFYMRQETLR